MMLDINSVKTVCGSSSQVMVYGRASCRYEQIGLLLTQQPDLHIKKTFQFKLGNPYEYEITLEGNQFEKMQLTLPLTISRICKAGLVNMVIENYRRIQQDLPLIPILFIITREQDPLPISAESLTSRSKENRLTHQELRRAYKLCTELENLTQTIIEVAVASFRFIKLQVNPTTLRYELHQVKPIWEAPEWSELWKKRLATRARTQLKDPEMNWRTQLKRMVTAPFRNNVILEKISLLYFKNEIQSMTEYANQLESNRINTSKIAFRD
jgi:hypothetical protein